jgi:hypothetical protein
VYGGLHLVGAVASARAGDRAVAQHLVAEARASAARLGSDRNDYWMSCGPTNVAWGRCRRGIATPDAAIATRARAVDLIEIHSSATRHLPNSRTGQGPP